jgi:hypothetical protein
MKISKNILIKVSLAVGLGAVLLGAFFKISHWQGAHTLYIGGLVATLVYMVIVLYEVFRSTRINKSEKIMWTICIILLSPITGLVYILSGRKRIIPVSK